MTSKLDPSAHKSRPAPPSPPHGETRRHPRIELPARCWIEDGEHTLYLRVHDVSRGGLSVRAPTPFSASHQIVLRLELPGQRTVRARAEVVWVRDSPAAELASGARMGARFLEFLEGEEDLYDVLGNA
jgi:hypothetical protein